MVVSRVVSSPGALRRSLVVWGWGQLAAGDRRGLAGPPAQLAALAGLVLVAPHAAGIAAPLVFLVFAGVAAAWALVAVHAWRRAARRRAALDATPGGGGGELLWLTPLAIALCAGFWVAAGPGRDPALTLDAYLADWRAGRAEVAAGRWTGAVPPSTVRDAWMRQESALRNALVRIVAEEPAVEADPERLFTGLRWVDLGTTEGGGRRLALEVDRREPVRGTVLGFLPIAGQRTVTVERLGTVDLAAVPVGPEGPLGRVVAWRIVRLELAGESAGG